MLEDKKISKTVETFLTQFENGVLPKIARYYYLLGKNGEKFSSYGQALPISCWVSDSSMQDPQFRQLLGIGADGSGKSDAKFMGIYVKTKPDMVVETYFDEEDERNTNG